MRQTLHCRYGPRAGGGGQRHSELGGSGGPEFYHRGDARARSVEGQAGTLCSGSAIKNN